MNGTIAAQFGDRLFPQPCDEKDDRQPNTELEEPVDLALGG